MSISSLELRSKFLDFFAKKGHQIVPSSPLLPQNDPTLLFVNAGMVQFKDVFTGKESRAYTRATSSQKCVRAGGKHNDLENVGRTARHHTFFEMLGNFSFGDYFKKDACMYAYEFLTKDLGIDPMRLSITVFGGEGNLPEDTEALEIWRDVVGVPESRISKKGMEDNFWAMGETGACGPCTEIHFDRSDVKSNFGGDDQEGDKNIEIWNIVFMQYERKADGSLIPLPKPSVDTGMGLERLCTVMNGLSSNYESDLLYPMIHSTEQLTGMKYSDSNNEHDVSMRVLADHSRAASFLIADGVLPSNEGRGYVLRRIMRRAIRHGARLGFKGAFFYKICDVVIDNFAKVYAELEEARELIKKVVIAEENAFNKTLERGLLYFEKAASEIEASGKLDGATVFHLYETYGFPSDLTQVLAEERGLTIDWDNFEQAKQKHEEASTSELGLSGVKDIFKALHEKWGATKFVGETHLSADAKIVSLLKDDQEVESLSEGQTGLAVTDQTSFYAESGGQVGDSGSLKSSHASADVKDTKKIADMHLHVVHLTQGTLRVGDVVRLDVDHKRRDDIRRHHSATHLLHSALRQVLGTHVTQKGSLVDENRTRFDFAHFEPMTQEQIHEVENLVNDWVLSNEAARVMHMNYDDAKKHGAMALFGEKYAQEVRVLEMGSHSTELCGGTHVHRTGDIGSFKIISESPLAAGIRRIEAVAGNVMVAKHREVNRYLQETGALLSSSVEEIPKRVQLLLSDLKNAQREITQLKQIEATRKSQESVKDAKTINGVQVIAQRLNDFDSSAMRDYADKLRHQLGSGIVVLGHAPELQKASILVAISPDLTHKYHAGNIVRELAAIIGGKGGGKADFAQAGGPLAAELDKALNKIYELV